MQFLQEAAWPWTISGQGPVGRDESSRLRKNHFGRLNIYGLHMCDRRRTPTQDHAAMK